MKNYYLIIGIVIAVFWGIIIIFGAKLPFVETNVEPDRMLFLPDGDVERAPFPPY
ncbi:hypothetical protein J9303_19055 [Bacillaceae bacterium Marseille-Q3522]|nr:hypothetical protein [Bacillaceae bacterium Marseille-Q3522]